MKLLSVILVFCGVISVSNAISCHVGGDAASAVATACNAEVTDCSGPNWSYNGYTNQAFACGACSGEAAGLCSTCSTENCNAPVTMAESYKCYSWSYVSDVWKMADAVTTCQRTTEQDAVCNAPARFVAASSTGYTKKFDGCGPCDATEKSNGNCLECTGDQCNASALVSVSAILFALVALLFLM